MPIVLFLTIFLEKLGGKALSSSGLDCLFRLCFRVLGYFAGKNLKDSLTDYLHADQ